jgi:membrane-associated phospholipid phosphatase
VTTEALFVTDFADQAVVMPVALAVFLALTLLRWRRASVAWGVGVTVTLAATLLLKLAVMACGIGSTSGLQSPSGHTAGAACIYGAAIALLVRDRWRGALAAALAAGALAAIVGLTRLDLGVHTHADVWVGSAVGIAGALAIRACAGERPAGLALWRVGAAALAAMLVFHGRRLDAEPHIRWAALRVWPRTLCPAGYALVEQTSASATASSAGPATAGVFR